MPVMLGGGVRAMDGDGERGPWQSGQRLLIRDLCRKSMCSRRRSESRGSVRIRLGGPCVRRADDRTSSSSSFCDAVGFDFLPRYGLMRCITNTLHAACVLSDFSVDSRWVSVGSSLDDRRLPGDKLLVRLLGEGDPCPPFTCPGSSTLRICSAKEARSHGARDDDPEPARPGGIGRFPAPAADPTDPILGSGLPLEAPLVHRRLATLRPMVDAKSQPSLLVPIVPAAASLPFRRLSCRSTNGGKSFRIAETR